MYNVIGVFLGLIYASVFLAGYILMFDLLRAVYAPDARFCVSVTAALLWPLTFVVCVAVLVPGVVVFFWDSTCRFLRGGRDLAMRRWPGVTLPTARVVDTSLEDPYSVDDHEHCDG